MKFHSLVPQEKQNLAFAFVFTRLHEGQCFCPGAADATEVAVRVGAGAEEGAGAGAFELRLGVE